MFHPGVEAWLGDETDGIKAQKNSTAQTMRAEAEWLDSVARKHIPTRNTQRIV